MGDRFREDRRGGKGCCGLGVIRDAFMEGVIYSCEWLEGVRVRGVLFRSGARGVWCLLLGLGSGDS